mmetsp:Transcript_5477/g.16188  ORF Transcript_5477/g.16188 Transcript_5477/m.16188 type:complete len:80 (-) Transcript_5477:50-289(-)
MAIPEPAMPEAPKIKKKTASGDEWPLSSNRVLYYVIIRAGPDEKKRVKGIRSYPSGAHPKDREKRGPKPVAFLGAEQLA